MRTSVAQSFLEYITDSTSLFTHVKMRALIQSTRFFVFNIIETLITSHLVDLKAMGDRFVAGYASLASGEKDPRNLMVAFAIARVVLVEFDISKHVDVGDRIGRASTTTEPSFFDAGLLRYHLLLFPDHFSSSTERSLWDQCR